MNAMAFCGLLPCMSSSDDVGETWTTPEANSILHLILVELRASERFRNFRPPVPLPVKLVSVLVLPNTLSCSNVSFRYHWTVAVLGGFFWFLRTTPFQNSKTFLLLSSS